MKLASPSQPMPPKTDKVGHVFPLVHDAAEEGGVFPLTSFPGSPHIFDVPVPALGTDVECPACCLPGICGLHSRHWPLCLIQHPRMAFRVLTGKASLLISCGHCYLSFPFWGLSFFSILLFLTVKSLFWPSIRRPFLFSKSTPTPASALVPSVLSTIPVTMPLTYLGWLRHTYLHFIATWIWGACVKEIRCEFILLFFIVFLKGREEKKNTKGRKRELAFIGR